MPNATLLDIVKQNGNDAIVGLIEESIQAHPEMNGAARTIKGTGFNSLVRTALPAVGFRSVNEGVATTKATYEKRRSSTFLVDASSEVDSAAGQASEDGLDAFLATEMDAKVASGMRNMASQFYYGTQSTVGVSSGAASPTKGFPGLIDLYDSTNMEVDAGGSSGTYTSVWAVRWGPKAAQWLFGNGGAFSIGETKEERLTDDDGNPYDGLRKAMTFYIGLHMADPRNGVCRLKKIDTSTTLTDDMLDEMVEKFASGLKPDALYMTRRSLRQLKDQRTATNPTGTPAPWPASIAGIAGANIPILTTDAISQAETA